MPKISDEQRAAVRRRISDAAAQAYLRKGLAATSMADIIAESGMSAGAIYGHFSGKAELTAEVARSVLAGRVDIIDELRRSETWLAPAELIEALLADVPNAIIDAGLPVQIWGAASPNGELQELAAESLDLVAAALTGYLAGRLVADGAKPAAAQRRAKQLAPAFLGLVQGCIVQRAIFGPDRAAVYLASVRLLVPSF